MDSELLKMVEDERQDILNEILNELETHSLKDLFRDTRDKEDRIREVRNILEILYGELKHYRRMVRRCKSKGPWAKYVSETLERIEEIENDYMNYIQGGVGYILGYLDSMYESD